MRKRTARRLRRIADRLDPKPARWYASAWQQSSNTGTMPTGFQYQAGPAPSRPHTRHRRVLADYFTPSDLKRLRP